MDEQVRFRGRPSVAVGWDGVMEGGEGDRSTVRSTDLPKRTRPLASTMRQPKLPLSLSYEALSMRKS